MIEREDFLWVEKYRPKTIDDCVLPKELKQTFKEFVEQGQIPNLILSGGPGIGKTTVAKALCNELDYDVLMINGSDEGRLIDTLRTTIKGFASTVSLTGSKKVVIIDEADYLNPQTVQPAMRNFIEEYSKTCRFIMTCNYKNRIIEPLHSRCSVIDFKIEPTDKPKIAATFFKRVIDILSTENVDADSKVVATLVEKFFPDWRRVLNELQRYSVSGKIDSGILVAGDTNIRDLTGALKSKDFAKVRKWAADNTDQDPVLIYKKMYESFSEFLKPQSVPEAILLLARYQYQAAFVANQEVNLVAFLTEVMISCEFE
jgi:DNA polymerase III delta prime subunit